MNGLNSPDSCQLLDLLGHLAVATVASRKEMESGSCYCATLSIAVMLLAVPSLTSQQPLDDLRLLQVSNHTCGSSMCAASANMALCKCDQACAFFGDCCIDAPQKDQDSSLSLDPNFRCISTMIQKNGTTNGRLSVMHYWMISRCPYTETNIKESQYGKDRLLKGTALLCETDLLSSPPVTDKATGLVYKNRYCAFCHGIPEVRLSPWSSYWECVNSFEEVIDRVEDEGTVDIETVLQSCAPTVFARTDEDTDDQFKYTLRECEPLVHNCPEQESSLLPDAYYQKIAKQCVTEPVNATTSVASGADYKNIYCALCNEPHAVLNSHLQCFSPQVPSQETFAVSSSLIGGFTLLLDITGTGEQVVRDEDIIVTSMKSETCAEGQVYDFYSNICRDTLCLPGYIFDGVRCSVIADGNSSKGNSSEDIHNNCSLITLNETEYLGVSNSTIYWIAVDIIIPVIGYTSEGFPIVCTNFTTNHTITFNKTATVSIFQYPEAFPILTYIGLSVDVIASILFLLTYCCFKELQTFYGKLLINFVSVILLGDIIFLGGTVAITYHQEEILCQTLAITVHYVFLVRFAWMLLLSLKLTVTFYKASKFISKNDEYEQNCRHLLGYMAFGWLAPIVIVGATVTFNFTLPGTVDYGRNGLCWINQPVAAAIAFVAPLGFCLILNGVAFIYITAIVIKIGCKAVGKHQRGRRAIRNFRVVMATLVVTSLTWGFGFIAVLDPSLSWAWYPYLVLNTMQALFVALAYLCSVKVFHLYRGACINLCKCFSSCRHGKGTIVQQRKGQVAPHLTSTPSSPELDPLDDSLVQIVNDSRFYVSLSDHIV